LVTLFSGDFENDVAFLEATLGCSALRIDLGDDDAILAGRPATLLAGRKASGRASARRCPLVAPPLSLFVVVGLGFDRIRQLPKRQVDGPCPGLYEARLSFTALPGASATDGTGEFRAHP